MMLMMKSMRMWVCKKCKVYIQRGGRIRILIFIIWIKLSNWKCYPLKLKALFLPSFVPPSAWHSLLWIYVSSFLHINVKTNPTLTHQFCDKMLHRRFSIVSEWIMQQMSSNVELVFFSLLLLHFLRLRLLHSFHSRLFCFYK